MSGIIHALFWPATLRPEINSLGRLGRVVHWSAAIVGGAWALMLVGIGLIPGSSDQLPLFGLAFAGLIPLAIGRGLRYVLANE